MPAVVVVGKGRLAAGVPAVDTVTAEVDGGEHEVMISIESAVAEIDKSKDLVQK